MTVESDLSLDIRQALSAVSQVERSIAQATAATLTLDTSRVANQVTTSIDAADTEVAVTADATQVAPTIDGAVDAADTQVGVTADATPVTGSIDGAVDAADTSVEVTGDGTQVTGAIDGAVDAADASVEVTADAAQVTGAIDGAVQAANTTVEITADDHGQLDSLGASSDALAGGLAGAASSGEGLRKVLEVVAGVETAKKLFETGQAASDLAESTSKATVVFGDGIDQIKAFGDTSAQALGLSRQEAIEAAATFGNLFTALGTTKAQATDLAPAVVSLASDLASFNNLAPDEVLEKLRSGLVGEVEPLRSLGISFNAAQVDAKAMELGLADANGTITEGAKLQARWALILEQSTTAQGDFARTSSGLANQQRILSAEVKNAEVAIGQALLPVLIEGVGVVREDLLPAFQQFATQVLPQLAKVALGLLPALSGVGSVLSALGPIVTLAAKGVGSLPPELLSLIGLFLLVRRFTPGLLDNLGSLGKKFQDLANPNVGPGGFSKSLKATVGDMVAASAPTVGFSLAVATIGLVLDENAKKAAEFRAGVKTISSGLKEAETSAQGFAAVFNDLIEQGGSAANLLAEVGIDADTFGRSISKGGDLTAIFAHQLGTTKDELGVLNLFLGDFTDQIQAAAKEQVLAIKASGDLTDETIKASEAAHSQTSAFGEINVKTTDYVAVLGDLKAAQTEAAGAIGTTTDETGKLVEATGPAADAAQVLSLSLAQVKANGGDLTAELDGLARAAGDARVADQDLQDVADGLGVSLDDLKTFVSSVNDAINQFADDTEKTLPSVSDIIGGLGDDFSPQALLDKLKQATDDIANFSKNLESLAAFPKVQQIAATNGPAVAAALAKPVQDGNTKIASELENQANAFDLTYAGLDTQLRTQLGPKVVDATGFTAKAMTDAFGANFDPVTKAENAHNQTIASIEQEAANPDTSKAGKDLADSYVGGFSTGIGGMPSATVNAANQSNSALDDQGPFANIAGLFFGAAYVGGQKTGLGGMPTATVSTATASTRALNEQGPFARIAGTLFGGAMAGGTSTGAAGMPRAADAAAGSAIAKVQAKNKAAEAAGAALGGALSAGMEAGINAAAQAVASAAAALVDAAIAAARRKADAHSPSRLFAQLGSDMAAGVAQGLDQGAAAVADSAASLITAAATASSGALDVSVAPFDVGSAVGSPVIFNAVPGMFQVAVSGPVSTEQAVATGRDLGQGFMSFVTEQQVKSFARSR